MFGAFLGSNIQLGNIVLRSPSLWTPDYYAYGANDAWYDPSDSTTITSAAFLVSQLDDKWNSHDLKQTTGSWQPATDTVTIGGLNALEFDGSNDFMIDTTMARSHPYSYISVLRTDTDTAGANYLNNQSANVGALYQESSLWSLYSGIDASAGAITTSTDTLIGAVFNLTNSKIYQNGTLEGTVNPGSGIGTGFTIGASNDGTFNFSDMYFGETFVFDTELSTVDRQKFEGYLAHKWSLTASLPSDHPYKSIHPTL